MIVWLNGPFGVGKTTTAEALSALLPDFRRFDPETVGFILRLCLSDLEVDDFQEWPAWRAVVTEAISALHDMTGQSFLVVQTVLREDYWDEIASRLCDRGLSIFHVLLTADEEAMRSRIGLSDEAREWRLDHLKVFDEQRPWMEARADFLLDTTSIGAAEAAARIATRVRRPSESDVEVAPRW